MSKSTIALSLTAGLIAGIIAGILSAYIVNSRIKSTVAGGATSIIPEAWKRAIGIK